MTPVHWFFAPKEEFFAYALRLEDDGKTLRSDSVQLDPLLPNAPSYGVTYVREGR